MKIINLLNKDNNIVLRSNKNPLYLIELHKYFI